MTLFKPKFLITGSAGFIGYHLSKLLLSKNYTVLGIDGFTDYYDVKLKKDRNRQLKKHSNFKDYECLLENYDKMSSICLKEKPDIIIHLAAQAGVRYSIENPRSYVDSNLIGTFNILELSKILKVKHLLIASTSSIYGFSEMFPFHENQKSDKQISFYAATKKANESMAHAYAYTYKIPTTVFRFFTVYGPWGRPDMALFKFTKAILSGNIIDIFNHGDMKRDFTFVDDLVKSIFLLSKKIPSNSKKRKKIFKNDSLSNVAPWRVVNIGNSKSIGLINYVNELELALGKKAKKNFVGMQVGDVKETLSDTKLLENLTGFKPDTSIEVGIKKFVDWYLTYYKINNY